MFCTDGSLPAGYVEQAEAGDCDDSDPNNWISCADCVDVDTDTHYVGCDAFVTINGPDCDDEDENNWISCGSCVDLDVDDFYAGCDAYVSIDGPDCNDTDVLTNPGAFDLPDDDIDQNCDGSDLVGADGPGVYVDKAAECPGTGTLQTPYCELQPALDIAADGDSIFVAGGGSPWYTAIQVDGEVGLFGGFSGGYQQPGGYVPGDWVRDSGPSRIEPDPELPVVVDIVDGSRLTMEGFAIFGSSLASGNMITVATGEFPAMADVTLVRNTIQGGTTANGDSTVCKLDGRAILVGNTVTGGNSTRDTRGLHLWGSAIVIDNNIDGGTSSGVVGGAGTRGVEVTMGQVKLLVNNYIHGGDGTRHSHGVSGQAWVIAINNIILGGDATEFSYGVSSPQQGTIQLFNNIIGGGQGDLESKGVSSFVWSQYADAYVVNNFIDPGMGAEAVCVQSRGPTHLVSNDLYQPGSAALLAYYNGTDYTHTGDLSEVNDCAWLYCEEGGGNLSEAGGFADFYFHLEDTSPLIDSGVDPADMILEGYGWYLLRDFEGDSRPLDGDGNGEAEWDIGRDELAP